MRTVCRGSVNILFLFKFLPTPFCMYGLICLHQSVLWCSNGDFSIFLIPSSFMSWNSSAKRVAPSSLFIQSFILYLHGFLGIYFIIWIIVYIIFILMLKLFHLWLLGHFLQPQDAFFWLCFYFLLFSRGMEWNGMEEVE